MLAVDLVVMGCWQTAGAQETLSKGHVDSICNINGLPPQDSIYDIFANFANPKTLFGSGRFRKGYSACIHT